MSINAYICLEKDDKSIIGVKCYSNGSLLGVGMNLFVYYDDPTSVENLVLLGDMERLGNNILPLNKTIPYYLSKKYAYDTISLFGNKAYYYFHDSTIFKGRDENLPNHETKYFKNMEHFLNNLANIDYIYLYQTDKVWRYFTASDSTIKDLREDIKMVLKRL